MIHCLLQLSEDRVLPGRFVPGDPKRIGLAADLTILNVALFHSGSGVNDSLVPLAATCALESCCHIGATADRFSGVISGFVMISSDAAPGEQ